MSRLEGERARDKVGNKLKDIEGCSIMTDMFRFTAGAARPTPLMWDVRKCKKSDPSFLRIPDVKLPPRQSRLSKRLEEIRRGWQEAEKVALQQAHAAEVERLRQHEAAELQKQRMEQEKLQEAAWKKFEELEKRKKLIEAEQKMLIDAEQKKLVVETERQKHEQQQQIVPFNRDRQQQPQHQQLQVVESSRSLTVASSSKQIAVIDEPQERCRLVRREDMRSKKQLLIEDDSASSSKRRQIVVTVDKDRSSGAQKSQSSGMGLMSSQSSGEMRCEKRSECYQQHQQHQEPLQSESSLSFAFSTRMFDGHLQQFRREKEAQLMQEMLPGMMLKMRNNEEEQAEKLALMKAEAILKQQKINHREEEARLKVELRQQLRHQCAYIKYEGTHRAARCTNMVDNSVHSFCVPCFRLYNNRKK